MRSAIVVLGLAACGGDGGTATPIDAATDADDHSYLLSFADTSGGPVYVAVRDGDDAWQQLVLTGGAGQFRVTRGFYSYLVGCPSASGGIRRVRIVRDAAAPSGPIPGCPGPGPQPAVRLSGAVADGAAVFAGSARADAAAGSYALAVAPGTYDVIAADTGRALIRRGEAVAADRTLDLDLAAGFDLITAPVTVTGADAVALRAELHTPGGTLAELDGSATAVGLVPVAERRPGDRLLVVVTALDEQGRRYRQHVVDGVAVAPFELSPPPVLWADRTGAIWVGDWDRATYQLRGEAFGEGTMDVTMTAAWAVRNHTDGDPVPWTDPVTLPGWDPSARVFQNIQLVRFTGVLDSGDRQGEWAAASDTGVFNW